MPEQEEHEVEAVGRRQGDQRLEGTGQAQAEPGEGDRAEHDRQRRRRLRRRVPAERQGQRPEHRDLHGLDGEDGQRLGGQQPRSPQRRGAEALQHAVLRSKPTPMARFTNAVDSTASASTPGARKSMGSPSIGQHVDVGEEHQQQHRDAEREQQRLAVAGQQRQLEAQVGGERPHPRRAEPSGVGGHQAQEHVLQALAPSPEVGQREVALGQPGGERRHEAGEPAARDEVLARRRPSVTGTPRRAARAVDIEPAGGRSAPRRRCRS